MKALITGGGGFLGSAILRQWLQRGHSARTYSRGSYPELENLGVEQAQGDLADASGVDSAIAGCEIVFHVAAKAGVWGPRAEYERANVLGTQNVIAACEHHGVKALVFTSSPSVTFDGRDQEGLTESAPYPSHFLADYPRTKAEAEKLVLAANGPHLAVTALRPHLIWGPADPHLVPRLLERAKAGKLKLIASMDAKKVDSVYIENAAHAHILAAELLLNSGAQAPCAGKAYFITNGEPLSMRELINGILNAGGLPPVTQTISPGVAYFAGSVFEMLYGALGKKNEPPLTRFVARQLSTAHWFDLSAARRDLGYVPLVSHAEGLQKLAAWLAQFQP